jgi:hypothetical protein
MDLKTVAFRDQDLSAGGTEDELRALALDEYVVQSGEDNLLGLRKTIDAGRDNELCIGMRSAVCKRVYKGLRIIRDGLAHTERICAYRCQDVAFRALDIEPAARSAVYRVKHLIWRTLGLIFGQNDFRRNFRRWTDAYEQQREGQKKKRKQTLQHLCAHRPCYVSMLIIPKVLCYCNELDVNTMIFEELC